MGSGPPEIGQQPFLFENFARGHNRNETSKVAVDHIVSFIQTKIHIHRTIITDQPFHTIFTPC